MNSKAPSGTQSRAWRLEMSSCRDTAKRRLAKQRQKLAQLQSIDDTGPRPRSLPLIAGLVFLLAHSGSSALGAEGGLIRSGEQADFSRIVMQIEPTTEWSLETISNRATIFFPGKVLGFSTDGIFEKIPRTRITDVEVETSEAGTSVRVRIGCDCRVSTSFVGARYLALDVADRSAPETNQSEIEAEAGELDMARAVDGTPSDTSRPPTDTDATQASGNSDRDTNEETGVGAPEPTQAAEPMAGLPDEEAFARAEELATRRAEETRDVYSAEEALLRQIERAAAQGLLADTSEEKNSDEPADRAATDPYFVASKAPEILQPPAKEGKPALPLSLEAADKSTDGLGGLSRHDQIQAMTVFDRYDARAPDRIQKSSLLPECIPDYRLDIDFWADSRPLFEQLPEILQKLYGEFDELNPAAVNEIAKLYVRFGFGAEAEALLDSFGAESADKRLLIDLARIMDGREVAPFGPLSRDLPCPGRHGMWLAIAGTTVAYRDARHFSTVEEAFADLPPDLRMHVGPRLMNNLLDGDHAFETRLIHDIITRVGDDPTYDLKLSKARLSAAEGDPVFAMKSLSSLVETAAPNADEALKELVELGLSGGYAIPDRTLIDLRSAALEHRGTDEEAELRALLAKSLAARAEMEAAIAEVRSAKADLGDDEYFDAVAVRILAESVPQHVGLANYARIVLSSEDMISAAPKNDVARQEIAENLLELGLASAAERIVMPAAGRHETGRLLLAQAFLTQGETEKTRKVLKGVSGESASDLRARAHFMDGDFSAAQAELDAAGLTERAETIAWPSGDWSRAQIAAETSARASMAEYMASQSNPVGPAAPSPDPGALDPEAAFVEPLPQLQDPSLDAARRLLATGGQVEDFIQSLLDGDSEPEPEELR